MVQNKFYKDIHRWNHIAVIPNMGSFLRELSEAHRTFKYFRSTDFFSWNKQNINFWKDLLLRIPRIVKKIYQSYHSVILFPNYEIKNT